MPSLHLVLLFVAATFAGAINSVAGGGTLLTFPALLSVGVAPVAANATSTVALVPGSFSAFYGYRDAMPSDKRALLWLGLPSLVGGALGAWAVIRVGDALFSRLVPWLILSATGLFLAQGPVRAWLDRRQTANKTANEAPRGIPIGTVFFQFLVALYGGFFGAGIGILMLAALGMMGLKSIHHMNGLKNFAAVCINGIAALAFILSRRVDWKLALLMMVGAIIGGYGGAGLAQRLGQANVRRLVVLIGLSMGLYTLVKTYVH